jgi:hypothetical protein
MRCIVSLVTVALGMAAMTVAVAMPALAAKPAPAKEECREALVALVRGENPRGNRNNSLASLEASSSVFGQVQGKEEV